MTVAWTQDTAQVMVILYKAINDSNAGPEIRLHSIIDGWDTPHCAILAKHLAILFNASVFLPRLKYLNSTEILSDAKDVLQRGFDCGPSYEHDCARAMVANATQANPLLPVPSSKEAIDLMVSTKPPPVRS